MSRDAVFVSLWSDPKYLKLHARKDAIGKMFRHAAQYDSVAAESVGRQFAAACRRISKYKDKALKAAGSGS